LGISAALFSSVAFMKDGLTAEGEISLKYAPDLTVQGITAGRQGYVNRSYAKIAQQAPGVASVSERVWGYGNIGNLLLVIVGVELNNPNVLSQAYPLDSGTFLNPLTNGSVVIGKAVADLIDAEVGSRLTILTESNIPQEFIVVGVFNSESGIYSADTIVMSIDDARQFFNVPSDKVTDILIYITDMGQNTKSTLVNYVARDLSELPNCRVVTKDILIKAQETAYGDRSGFFSIVWYVVLISVAIIAFNQTVVVGHESKFEVGLLKSLGFSISDIIQIRFVESLVLGLIAGALGLTFGIVYDVFLGAPMLREFMMGWATLYPGFSIPVLISSTTVLFTFAVTIVPLLFATVVPSWLNATVDPDIAMRGARA
jgi:ABC-type lipoprotein release transport system permease subunit